LSASSVTFFLYLAGIIAIGLYFMRMVKTYDDFMIGGRRVGPWVSSFSLITSYMSGYTYTAAPGLGYSSGYSALWWASGDAPGNSLSFGVLGRRLRKYSELLGAITLPEFYEKRYQSPALRVLSSLIIFVFVAMYLVAQWTASGKLLSITFGTSYVFGMIVGGVVVLAYTILGGYLAVVYTDFVQGIIMFIGSQVLFWTALFKCGGFAAFTDKLGAISPELITPGGPGGAYLGLMAMATPIILIIMGSFGMPHVTVRHLSLSKPSAARKAMLITCVFVVLFSFAYYLTGALALTLLGEGLEDIETAGVRLWFAVLPPVIAGILSSAAVASIMSTADSFLILLVTTLGHDLLYRFISPHAPERVRMMWARILVAVLTIGTFLIALNPPALVFTIVIFAFGGMALAFGVPNLFSVYWKRTTETGVLACMILSLAVYVWATAGSLNILGLHPFILGLIVAVASIIIGSLCSAPPRPAEQELFNQAAAYGDLPEPVAVGVSACVSSEAETAWKSSMVLGPAALPQGAAD